MQNAIRCGERNNPLQGRHPGWRDMLVGVAAEILGLDGADLGSRTGGDRTGMEDRVGPIEALLREVHRRQERRVPRRILGGGERVRERSVRIYRFLLVEITETIYKLQFAVVSVIGRKNHIKYINI